MQPDYQTPERMAKKLHAIPLPDLTGKSVIDIGCDMRFWCNLATERGASKVVGVDRGRDARGQPINMADFKMDLGKQWKQVGKFDVAFMFSMYHHAYQSAGGDHKAVFFWALNQLKPDGVLIWEGPVDTRDVVVQKNIEPALQENYNLDAILDAAAEYFDVQFIGPAEHEEHRLVFYFYPRSRPWRCLEVEAIAGAGGASQAFNFAGGRRINEIAEATGMLCYPGSLNLVAERSINWWGRYYRAQILDLKDRKTGLNGEWEKRWARLYPVEFNGQEAFVFRFESEAYSLKFFELVAPVRLRDYLEDKNTLCH
jgi:hypothetical protein